MEWIYRDTPGSLRKGRGCAVAVVDASELDLSPCKFPM